LTTCQAATLSLLAMNGLSSKSLRRGVLAVIGGAGRSRGDPTVGSVVCRTGMPAPWQG